MGESIAVLGLAAAVLAAALRWELPARPIPPPVAAAARARLDAAVQKGVLFPRTKPQVKIKIRVRAVKVAPEQDNSNGSYAALGLRASGVPDGAPAWVRRAGARLEAMNRSITWSLKELARKSILGRVT